jgi:hypothetical protein
MSSRIFKLAQSFLNRKKKKKKKSIINKLYHITETYYDESFLKMDGFDSCVIGMDQTNLKLIYSKKAILDVLINENDLSELEAIEYYEFNILGCYMGEKTPILCDDIF